MVSIRQQIREKGKKLFPNKSEYKEYNGFKCGGSYGYKLAIQEAIKWLEHNNQLSQETIDDFENELKL